MSQPLPLAAASTRLRKRPGRPRKHPPAEDFGHSPGTVPAGARVNSGVGRSPEPREGHALSPRLLDLRGASSYLSVRRRVISDLCVAGVLPRVRLVLPDGREMRKVLIDKLDLDALVDRWKGGGAR